MVSGRVFFLLFRRSMGSDMEGGLTGYESALVLNNRRTYPFYPVIRYDK